MSVGPRRLVAGLGVAAFAMTGCFGPDAAETSIEDTGSGEVAAELVDPAVTSTTAAAPVDPPVDEPVDAPVDAGKLDAFSIQVGQCLGEEGFGEIVEAVQELSCSGPHAYEVFASFDIDAPVYPTDFIIDRDAADGCLERFETFVGHAYETSVYDISYLTPTQESWDELDDREVLCLLFNYDGTDKTGSAEGSAI